MRNFVLFALTLAVLGCSKSDNKPVSAKPTDSQGVSQPLSCSAVVTTSNVTDGVPTTISVTVAGGAFPYHFPGTSTVFGPATTILRTYANDTLQNIVVDDQVTVADYFNQETTCSFKVTVKPHVNPSDLACTLVATPSTVALNTEVDFVATSTGGTGTRVLSNFSAGNSSVVIDAFDPATGTASAKYTTSGQKTASVTVTDSANNVATCSASVNVNPGPSIAVSASPGIQQTVGSPLNLTVTPSNFVNPPTTYTFVPSSSAVTVTQSSSSSNLASLSATSAVSFQVTVTASNANETASAIISLSFVSANPLTCVAFSYDDSTWSGETFLAGATPSYQNGWVKIEDVFVNPATSGYWSRATDTQAWVTLNYFGTYTVTLRLKDTLNNRTADCSFTQFVY